MSLDDHDVDEIWMDGEFVDWADATIHALAHVANYGTGVFEGSRCYRTDRGPAIFRLDAHLDRLWDSASIMGMDPSHDRATVRDATTALLARNGLDSAYIRHNTFYGYSSLGLDTSDNPVRTLVAAFPRGTYLGEDALETGAEVEISPWRRLHSSQFPTQAKAVGIYAMATLAKRHAVANGYDEAVMLDADGNVAEGSGENLFVVSDGRLYTPGLDASILPGITRDSLVTLARDAGYEVEVGPVTTGQLYTADEAFMCGTAAEVTPIRSVDDVTIGDGTRGPVTADLQERFFEVVRGEREAYHDWLTFVEADG
ncbi:MAG: branched-chain amino acid transaminase [Haloferacaceae archaeon]